MHTRSNLNILYTILVVMVAQAHCSELMCYICENCAEITENTPKQICNESFFDNEPTLPPTLTTDPTTETPTTTTVETTDTTVSESTQSTSPTPPRPPTAGPVETTTPLPTPPNPGTVAGPIELELTKLNATTNAQAPNPGTVTGPIELELTRLNATTTVEIPNPGTVAEMTDMKLAKFNATTTDTTAAQTTSQTTSDFTDTTLPTTFLEPVHFSISPAEIRMRQLRSVYNAEFTYHCYTVKQKINESMTTSRGCSRVGPTEAVCQQLEQTNNNTKYSSCSPCTNTLCNSSSAIGTSMVAMFLGLSMALLFRSIA